MILAGCQKCSFVDYPGHLAAVAFTPGCNMNCFYCHNPELLSGPGPQRLDEAEMLDFLASRAGLLDAVVVSGGEPTLQHDLPDFIARVRRLGFAVKLDTNGTNPTMLRQLISARLVDYVAMDIKASVRKYEQVTRTPVDNEAIEESILTLLAGQVDYEFRTTVAPPLRAADICQIASRIAGARRYTLQQYRPDEALASAAIPHTDAYLRSTARLIQPFVDEVIVRGAGESAVQARLDSETRLANSA
ncbi:MAG: anaerobic ribonucleoside-triphosphate reductase activating protein [Phycisphaerae bacterium]